MVVKFSFFSRRGSRKASPGLGVVYGAVSRVFVFLVLGGGERARPIVDSSSGLGRLSHHDYALVLLLRYNLCRPGHWRSW